MATSQRKRSWLLPLTIGTVVGAVWFSLHTREAVAGDPSQDDDETALAGGNDDHDPTVLSFATVGDSRQDPDKPDPTTVPLSGQDATWLQNTKAWARIMRSVQKQHAKLLFFNGDMIMGYGNMIVPSDTSTVDKVVKSDLVAAYRQYGFWRGMVATLMETGTYVVPVAGNHETQWKAGGKKAQVANENAWRANMGDLILDTTRFDDLFGETPANADVADHAVLDSLVSDQRQLSYSFDFHGSHFAIVNTDPVGKDAHAPTNWLAADLAAAKARGQTHFFVFGHKPAFTYYFGVASTLPATPSGLDGDVAARDAFWAVIEQYGATYFCGHEHIYNLSQPTAAAGGHAWQVMVGSGGSPFEAAPTDQTLAKTDRFYAWARVDVRKSGRVVVTGWGFDDHFGNTKHLQTLTLPH
jgi:hypothetical protein